MCAFKETRQKLNEEFLPLKPVSNFCARNKLDQLNRPPFVLLNSSNHDRVKYRSIQFNQLPFQNKYLLGTLLPDTIMNMILGFMIFCDNKSASNMADEAVTGRFLRHEFNGVTFIREERKEFVIVGA